MTEQDEQNDRWIKHMDRVDALLDRDFAQRDRLDVTIDSWRVLGERMARFLDRLEELG